MSGYDGYGDEPPPRFGGQPNRGRQTQGRGRTFQSKQNDRGDYVEVDKRIQEFYAKYPEGRLESSIVSLDVRGYEVQERNTRDNNGNTKIKQVPVLTGVVVVQALAYRTPDDPHPGSGHSWMIMPGQTPYTLGSELENAETSAWGRAIAAVGLAVRGGIATADEIRAKRGDDDGESVPDAVPETAEKNATEAARHMEPPPPPARQENTVRALPVDSTTVVPRSLDHLSDEQVSAMTLEVLLELAREKFIPSATITSTAKRVFGTVNVRTLSDEQRQQLWHVLTTGDISGAEPTESPQPSG